MSTEEVVINDAEEQTTEETTPQEEQTVETAVTTEEANPQETNEAEQVQKEIEQSQQAEKEVKEDLAKKGIEFEKCVEEYMKNGSLSEETYKALHEAGYTKNIVDAYIAGVNAQNERFTNTILATVGGEEEYGKITAFIQSQGNAAVDAYNALLDSGNISALTMYLNGCKAQMVLKNGTSNRSILGSQVHKEVNGFADETEMVKAMTDPRYKTDPTYAKQVAMKLEKSSFVKYGR